MLRAPITGNKRIWLDFSISNSPAKRVNISLFDTAYQAPTSKIFEKIKAEPGWMIGPIKGMVEKDFLLTGSREDPRSSGVIKFIDYERLVFDSSRDSNQNFFLGHHNSGLVSIEKDSAGVELLISLGACPYFDREPLGNLPSSRERVVVGVVEDLKSIYEFHGMLVAEETGLPVTGSVQVINAGVPNQDLSEAELKELNKRISNYQFEDLKPRNRLFYKIISGSGDLITFRDFISWTTSWGIIYGFIVFLIYSWQKQSKKFNRIDWAAATAR
ncbi:unnamed protein product [Oikopleura dioica]|uniref:PPIase cyclophilin-type domain-containing protein n=2 Tax=Oikopleura dioica TaxID=34765 RepID=E4XM03_OIKDI|nr:unnamed protein product [Oikopleura dioica]